MTNRHDKKNDGHKAASRKEAQGQTTAGLLARARRQVGNTGPVNHPSFAQVSGRVVGGYADVKSRTRVTMDEALSIPEIPEGSQECGKCGKVTRVKKDGTPYKHACKE